MTVHITMTSDFICPWCLIGKARLAEAIASLPSDIDVEVAFAPFELNPDMPKEGMDRHLYRSLKFGSWTRSQQLDAQTVTAAKNDAVTFRYDLMKRTPNTFDAHRLSAFAAEKGCQPVMVDALLKAYFEEGQDIGDRRTLIDIAGGTGFDQESIRVFLESDEGIAALRSRIDSANVRGVPHFAINGTAVAGAQSPQVLKNTIIAANHGAGVPHAAE